MERAMNYIANNIKIAIANLSLGGGSSAGMDTA